MFKLEKSEQGWEIYCGEDLIASTVGAKYALDESGLGFTDNICECENGLYKIDRTYANISDIDIDAVFIFEINAAFPASFYMIPCVSYNGNQWGTGNEPKGLEYNGEPWVFAYDRVAVPSATFSENQEYALAVFASDCNADSLMSACSLARNAAPGAAKYLTHRIFWPERETPVTYNGRDTYGPALEKTVKIKAREKFAVQFYVSVSKTHTRNYGWTQAFDRAWKIFRRAVSNPVSGETYRKWRVEYIRDMQYVNIDDKYSLFEMGLLASGVNYMGSPGEIFEFRQNYQYEIGWCGQNAAEALALLHDYALTGDADSLEKGRAVLDTWAKYAPCGNGLFQVVFDNIINNNQEYAIDTCNLGWGAWIMLEAYKLVGTNCVRPHDCFDGRTQFVPAINGDEWLKFGLDLCDFFVENRAPDGSFGKTWSADGICTDIGGTIGCYILLAMMEAYKLTGDIKYLDVTKEMYIFYAERDLMQVSCTAGALDTHCIDKETCWPLCKIGLDLYEETQDIKFLEYAKLAGYYMLSFMFHYDALYDDDSDFAQLGYRTYGATSVSTQHHHLDPWGSLLCYDWYRLYKITGDIMWKERFEAGWMNAMLGVSDGELIVHGIKRPVSSQNEGFWHCNWIPGGGNYKRGTFNDWLQSWVGAFKLITLIREPDRAIFE